MKEKIYEVVRKYGKNGIRLRTIGSILGVWHCGLIGDIYELIDEGKLEVKTIGQGWDAYNKYYIKEKNI